MEKGLAVIVVEKLGGQVSYGKDKIRVLKATYEKVPEEHRQEFLDLVGHSCVVYNQKVADCKAQGEKPSSPKIKSEVWQEVVQPFLSQYGVSEAKPVKEPKVIKTTDDMADRVAEARNKVSKKVAMFQPDVERPSEDVLKQKFDTYPSDMLKDVDEKDEHKTDELGIDDMFDVGDEIPQAVFEDEKDFFSDKDELDLDI